MNFDFSEDQKALGEHVRRFLADKCPRTALRSALDGDRAQATEAWRGLIDMGLAGTAIAPEYGGSGLGYLELCVVAEELGRALAPVPFSSSVYMAAEAIAMAGSAAQKEEWLPKLASGEIVGTFAATEKSAGPLTANVSTTLTNGTISGRKFPVPDGEAADIAIVLVRSGGAGADGLSLALVDLKQSSVASSPIQTIDPSRPHSVTTFDRATGQLLGNQGEGAALLRRLYDRAAILFAFEQIGGADAALEMAVAFAKERIAFGRPIGSFQAIKHKLAEIYMRNTLARSHAYYGAWALSSDAPELPLAAAAARAAASEAFDFAAKENAQTHGGMGFTWEADCHLFYRRARLLSLNLGSPRIYKDRLVSELEKRRVA